LLKLAFFIVAQNWDVVCPDVLVGLAIQDAVPVVSNEEFLGCAHIHAPWV